MAERKMVKEALVKAAPGEVYRAWTTVEGVKTFFAPDARIEPEPGGAYELYFEDGPAGQRGSEGCRFLELEPDRRLAFTWNFPPSLPGIRNEHTVVTVDLAAAQPGQTRVWVSVTGWKQGGEWDLGWTWFDRAWSLVLQRLGERFVDGPIDWSKV